MTCGDICVTLSNVVPLYTELLKHFGIFLSISTLISVMKAAVIKLKDTLELYYDISGHSCTVETLLDPRIWYDYYSVRYDEDPDTNEGPEDIL